MKTILSVIVGAIVSYAILATRVESHEAGAAQPSVEEAKAGLIEQVASNELRLVPVGSIIAWHKNIDYPRSDSRFTEDPDMPALMIPAGWVECTNASGDRIVEDPDSPITGRVIPHLNSAAESMPGGKFLRGSTVSGIHEQDSLQGHAHTIGTLYGSELMGPLVEQLPEGPQAWGSSVQRRNRPGKQNYFARSIIDDGSNGSVRIGKETRPVNMSVVWIMRIK